MHLLLVAMHLLRKNKSAQCTCHPYPSIPRHKPAIHGAIVPTSSCIEVRLLKLKHTALVAIKEASLCQVIFLKHLSFVLRATASATKNFSNNVLSLTAGGERNTTNTNEKLVKSGQLIWSCIGQTFASCFVGTTR